MFYALVLLQAVTPLWLVMNTPLFKDQKKRNNNNNEIKQNKEEKDGKVSDKEICNIKMFPNPSFFLLFIFRILVGRDVAYVLSISKDQILV